MSPPTRVPSQWRPIETAPKDGTRVLLLAGETPAIGRWIDDRYVKKPQPFWANERDYGRIMQRARQPTHWMPLPPPPIDAGSDGLNRLTPRTAAGRWRPIAEASAELQRSAAYITAHAGEYRMRLCHLYDYEKHEHSVWAVICEGGGGGVTHFLDRPLPEPDWGAAPWLPGAVEP